MFSQTAILPLKPLLCLGRHLVQQEHQHYGTDKERGAAHDQDHAKHFGKLVLHGSSSRVLTGMKQIHNIIAHREAPHG